MRSVTITLVMAACLLVAAGCISISQPGQASLAPSGQVAASDPPQSPTPSSEPATAAPFSLPPFSLPPASPSGAETVVVIIDNGEDQGTYRASGDPNCSHGAIGDDVWAAQFGNILAAPGELSSLQMTDEPDSSDKKGKSRIVSFYLTVGPVFAGRSYTLQGDRFNSNDYTYEIDDQGTTAVIHFKGTTLENPLGPGGVGIDLTVSCPSVSRG